MRIAVTGSQGQVAQALRERGAERQIEIVTLARPRIDLAEPATIAPAIAAAAADLIVNAAAFTAVDKAEGEEALATRINGAGAGAVARAAAAQGVPIIHLSTDYVFDGALDRPYREDDPTGPINAYGRSKLAGETAVRAANPRHVILRTAWVYSPFGVNFVRTMLWLGETRPIVGVVADQTGAPTCALAMADAILDIGRRLQAAEGDERLLGTFHLTGGGVASWADFAEAVFAEAALHGRRAVAVRRMTSDEYPTAARRPANSRLDNEKLMRTYAIALPAWQMSLASVIQRLLENA
jgi:dTDP-4-dehydrorhamnose reductase